jgi:O-antigen/teichoic acid export membrane protein
MISDVTVWMKPQTWRGAHSGSLRARFAHGAWWSTIAAGSSRAIILMAAVVCGRILGRAGFGELGMVQSTAGVFGVFAGFNLGITANRYLAEFRETDPARAGRILTLSSMAALTGGALLSLALILSAPYLAIHTLAAPQLARSLAIGSGLIFFGALNGVQMGALSGFESFRDMARVNVWSGLLGFVLIATGVRFGGVAGAVWGYVGAAAVNWLMSHMVLRRKCTLYGVSGTARHCLQEWPILLKFSAPAFLSSAMLAPTIFACNAFLVHQHAGYSALGLFTAADRWRVALLFLPNSIMTMAFPMLFNLRGARNHQGFRRVFQANLAANLLAVMLPGMVIALLSPLIMSAYGPAYREGWRVLLVLALTAVPQCLNSVFGQMVVARSMWIRFAFDLMLTSLLIGSAFVLIPRLGALGLAFAYLAAYTVTTIGLAIFVGSKRSPLRDQTERIAA